MNIHYFIFLLFFENQENTCGPHVGQQLGVCLYFIFPFFWNSRRYGIYGGQQHGIWICIVCFMLDPTWVVVNIVWLMLVCEKCWFFKWHREDGGKYSSDIERWLWGILTLIISSLSTHVSKIRLPFFFWHVFLYHTKKKCQCVHNFRLHFISNWMTCVMTHGREDFVGVPNESCNHLLSIRGKMVISACNCNPKIWVRRISTWFLPTVKALHSSPWKGNDSIWGYLSNPPNSWMLEITTYTPIPSLCAYKTSWLLRWHPFPL